MFRFITGYSDGPAGFGSCSFEVWATNELLHGRYAVRGVHISVGISDPINQLHTNAEIYKEAVFSENDITNYDVNDTEIYHVR